MKKLSFLFVFIAVYSYSMFTQAQDFDIPSGSVMRMVNCKIIDERFNFNDVVERARVLEFDENAPNIIFFRRPIYATPEYHESWDMQIAAYYSSYTEMVDRRVASGDNSYGRLPISCSSPFVARNVIINPTDSQLEDQTAMLTRFCTLNQGASYRSAYNRMRTATENFASAGNTSMTQMWTPGLGGPRNADFDFVLAVVGPNRSELTERLDMMRNGFRPVPAVNSPSFSCDRPSMWATSRVYQASN